MKWIYIEDKLPPENHPILVCMRDSSIEINWVENCMWIEGVKGRTINNKLAVPTRITHWMPLPEPPK